MPLEPVRHRSLSLLGVLFGTALLGLGYGWAALGGGITLALSGAQRERLYAREDMPPMELQAFIYRRQQMLRFWDSWLGYDDLAQAALAQAEKIGIDTKTGRDAMPGVIGLEKEALLRNPANSFAWARLAYARLIYNGPSKLVTAPLLLSIQAAPYEPSLLPSRIALMLGTKSYWNEEMTALFPQQLERAWISEAYETTRAVFLDHQVEALRPYLQNAPAKLAQFDKWIGEMHAAASE